MNLLGMPGKIWMTLVAALAFISTQNSTINGLAAICQGMAKMNMMPQFFAKTNRNKVPFIGVWIITIAILIFAYVSSDSSDAISFFILVGSVFWMISYIIAHIDVIVLRRRLPKAPVPSRSPAAFCCLSSGFSARPTWSSIFPRIPQKNTPSGGGPAARS